MTSLDAFTRTTRVAVVAADARVRTSLRHLLTSVGGTVVVVPPTAGPSHATSSGLVDPDADVVVLELEPATPESHLAQLRRMPGGLRVVVLGSDRATAEFARAAGASYLDKADVADRLLDTVLRASSRPARGTAGAGGHSGAGGRLESDRVDRDTPRRSPSDAGR